MADPIPLEGQPDWKAAPGAYKQLEDIRALNEATAAASQAERIAKLTGQTETTVTGAAEAPEATEADQQQAA